MVVSDVEFQTYELFAYHWVVSINPCFYSKTQLFVGHWVGYAFWTAVAALARHQSTLTNSLPHYWPLPKWGVHIQKAWTPKVPILQVVLLFRMQLWPVAHFSTQFWVGATAKQQQTHPKVSEKCGQLVRVAFGKEVLLVK